MVQELTEQTENGNMIPWQTKLLQERKKKSFRDIEMMQAIEKPADGKKDLCTVDNQYYGSWWSGNMSSAGIFWPEPQKG